MAAATVETVATTAWQPGRKQSVCACAGVGARGSACVYVYGGGPLLRIDASATSELLAVYL